MRRARRATTLLVILLLLPIIAATANALAFAYRVEVYIDVPSQELAGRTCIGLVPPPSQETVRVEVLPGRELECGHVVVYESLRLRVSATPGSYVFSVGRLYVRTEQPLTVVLYVESGLAGQEAVLIAESPRGSIALPLIAGNSALLSFDTGESTVDLYLKLRAVSPGVDYFRVGFYTSSR
ncbi:MAG: hypothetical protein QXS85_04815 [Acidilobaceae archaeon]